MSNQGHQGPQQTTRGVVASGYTLWQYTAGTWVLKKIANEEGYECGPSPLEPGSYEGEIRKTACVRAAKTVAAE